MQRNQLQEYTAQSTEDFFSTRRYYLLILHGRNPCEDSSYIQVLPRYLCYQLVWGNIKKCPLTTRQDTFFPWASEQILETDEEASTLPLFKKITEGSWKIPNLLTTNTPQVATQISKHSSDFWVSLQVLACRRSDCSHSPCPLLLILNTSHAKI